jgi:hypothetical protein
MLLLVLVSMSLGCQPTPVTTVKKNSATTAKPIADPDPTTPQETVSKPEPSDPLPPPQTYTRPDDAAVSALAETPLEELMALLADAKHRDAAAFTLGQIGADARPAVEALQAQAEKDDNEIARDAAVFALDAIQEPES